MSEDSQTISDGAVAPSLGLALLLTYAEDLILDSLLLTTTRSLLHWLAGDL